MPVFSFLVYPEKEQKAQMIKALSKMPHCEITPSENEDVVILLLDTPDEQTNKDLITAIRDLDSVQSLSMTFGHAD